LKKEKKEGGKAGRKRKTAKTLNIVGSDPLYGPPGKKEGLTQEAAFWWNVGEVEEEREFL